MADHRCPACGAAAPRGAGFCPACGTALRAPGLPFESAAHASMATEHEVALGARAVSPRRSALVVGAVAVVVIGAGLVVGSGGDDGEAGQPPAVTTAAPPSTTEQSTRTTVRRTTTTTSVPRFMTAAMPELAGQTLYAVVSDRVVRIDAGTGETTVLGDGSRRAEDWSWLVPRAGGVVVAGDRPAFFSDDGSTIVELPAMGGGVFPATDPALVWIQEYGRDGGSAARLVEVATGDAVAQVDLPPYAYPVGSSGAGLLVQTDGGGVYVVDPSGSATQVSEGSFRSATATHLVQFRCDEQFVCGHEVVDLVTGQTLPVEVPTAEPYPIALTPDPTGARLAVVGNNSEFSVIDLATGSVSTIADTTVTYTNGSPVTWTADGRQLVWAGLRCIYTLAVDTLEPVQHVIMNDSGADATVTAVVVGL